MNPTDPQRGSATVLGIAIIGLIVMTGMAIAAVLGAVAARIETETAADAAALAAVAAAVDGRGPQAAAASAADANGAQLVHCRCPAFSGGTFSASVLVARDIRMPLLGERRIVIQRSAEFSVTP